MSTKGKQPQQASVESNPDPIKDEKDLTEFYKLLNQEKLKVLQKNK